MIYPANAHRPNFLEGEPFPEWGQLWRDISFRKFFQKLVSKDTARITYCTGTRCFNSSNQFRTTLICVGAEVSSGALNIKKRWPSGETS